MKKSKIRIFYCDSIYLDYHLKEIYIKRPYSCDLKSSLTGNERRPKIYKILKK